MNSTTGSTPPISEDFDFSITFTVVGGEVIVGFLCLDCHSYFERKKGEGFVCSCEKELDSSHVSKLMRKIKDSLVEEKDSVVIPEVGTGSVSRRIFNFVRTLTDGVCRR